VENDIDMCGIIRDILSEEGYSVIVAHSGEIALSKIRKKQFDLMILDYKLSGISGLTVFEKLREMEPLMKVIMMSAFGNEATKRKAKELGAYAFLDKPFNINLLVSIVKKAVRKKSTTVNNFMFNGVRSEI
ncbi:MAG: response regulator, partial [Candidatus Omnitrophota bacterium]